MDVIGVTDAELLPSTVMAALGKPRTSSATPMDLGIFLAEQDLLLVLDNCDRLTDACADLVSEVLEHCASVSVLTTSREALRLPGEVVRAVPPLQLVAQGSTRWSDALTLFVERATAANPGFLLKAADVPLIVELCRRLDGLPLAIELAAASTRVLSVHTLLEHAQWGLPETVPGHRSTPERHQSLEAMIAHSYDLCSPAARLLWARMSVFRNTVDLEALETVCGDPSLPSAQIWRVLTELVDKSVITFDGRAYTMLAVIRSYGRARLRDSGEESRVLTAHCAYVAALAADVAAGWFGPDQPALLDRALWHHADISGALSFCLDDPSRTSVGLRLAADLYAVWLSGGLPYEGRVWLGRLLELEASDADRSAAMWVMGFLASVDGDIPGGISMLRRAEELARKAGDRASHAHAVQKRGMAELHRGNTDLAVQVLIEAVALERGLDGFNPFLADALLNLGSALCFAGRTSAAEEALLEAQRHCDEHGEQLLLSWVHILRATNAFAVADLAGAGELARAALAILDTINAPLGVVWGVEILAWIAQARGQDELAARLLGGSVGLSAPLGRHMTGFHSMVDLHERCVAKVEISLGSERWQVLSGEGKAMSRADLTAAAMQVVPLVLPSRPDPLERFSLTPREREISLLIAQGHTNREIAAELVISRRTVDTHVEHIFTKLDFTSRAQVAALVGASGASG